MKKEAVAKKMKSLNKYAKRDRQPPTDTVEGDFSKHLGPQDKFSEKDETKEKKMRSAKHGKMPKANWEI